MNDSYEYNVLLCLLFIDFKQAYDDTIIRNTLLNDLKQSNKITNLTESTIEKTYNMKYWQRVNSVR